MFWDSEAHNAVQLWNAENNGSRMAWQIAIWEAGSSLQDVMHVACQWFVEFEQVSVNMLYRIKTPLPRVTYNVWTSLCSEMRCPSGKMPMKDIPSGRSFHQNQKNKDNANDNTANLAISAPAITLLLQFKEKEAFPLSHSRQTPSSASGWHHPNELGLLAMGLFFPLCPTCPSLFHLCPLQNKSIFSSCFL